VSERLEQSHRAVLATAVALLTSTAAFALYGGHEHDFRTFGMGREYFLDELSFQPLPSVLEEWYEAELRPGGARGWRLFDGSLNTFDSFIEQELALEYPFVSPWSWSFRHEQGQAPDGRYVRTWAGAKAALGSGWSAGLELTPLGDKEFIDVALSFGRESLAPAGDRIRLRWETRVIFTDNWYNPKNEENASFDYKPLDLQLSLLASWDSGSWVSLELDRDLPFRKTYLDPEPVPEDESRVFSFERFEATLRGLVKLGAHDRLLPRLVVHSSDRGDDYFTTAGDRLIAHDLWLAGVEWWRRLDEMNEIAFGYEIVDFDESSLTPDDAVDPGWASDRIDHIISLRHRRRVRERLYVTTSLWNDFLDWDTYDLAGGKESIVRSESKLSVSLETSADPGPPRSSHFVVGFYAELDSVGGGGYVRFSALF
jgi:hypothetical protein